MRDDLVCGEAAPLTTTEKREALERAIAVPSPDRLYQVAHALRLGLSLERAHELTRIDPWFLREIAAVMTVEARAAARRRWHRVARGSSASGISAIAGSRRCVMTGLEADGARAAPPRGGIRPVYKRVDTCAAEYESHTPYLYSTYEDECEARPSDRRKVIILGGGPNRIGQGIEFDYCCVHAAMALREEGIESIMVNCNPETVSTDYDTSDRLYFEPLTLEDVLAICDVEKPWGVIVQFGGQTPLKLAVPLAAAGVPILGTSADAIDRAEDRERFGAVLTKLGLRAPRWGIARSLDEARTVAREIGFPVMVRPSYVLGGRAMERVYDARGLEDYFARLALAAGNDEGSGVGFPLLVDQFLAEAVELDVDVVADRTAAVIVGGVMEHIEEAGIHCAATRRARCRRVLAARRHLIDEVKRQARRAPRSSSAWSA